MPHILALDQGTTSSRAVVFDESGDVRGLAQREFTQHFPRPGWVEHDPEEVWQTQLDTARRAIERAKLTADEIAAIGITNQRETVVVWDRRTGQPIAPAIVWQDRRTAGHCDQLRSDGFEPLVREKTGLVVDAYFSASKAAWLLDHVEGARRRAERGELALGTIDSWLIYKLTGGRVHATDVTNAGRTQLLNIHAGVWDDELLELWGVPRAMLPDVKASSAVVGETDASHFGAPLPIGGVAGDQQAALFGQMALRPGTTKNTYGTGCFMLMSTGDTAHRSKHRLLTTPAWRIGDRTGYALEGSVFIAGAVVQWLRDGLGVIGDAKEVEPLARSVDDNGGVYLVPAFAGLGAPHWDAYARGAIVGLTRGATKAHFARAALESIAYQSADVMDAMRDDAQLEMAELRVDGGASGNDLLMQFQADVLQTPLVRPAVTETTALGAAYLAGLAVGVWRDTDELAKHWRADRRFEPAMSRDQAEALRAQWRKAIERARAWEEAEA